MLEVVTSAEDLANNPDTATGISYFKALHFVTDGFLHTDELVDILLHPIEHRQISLRERCADEIALLRHRLESLSGIEITIRNLSLTLDQFQKKVAISEAERNAFRASISAHAQLLMEMVATVSDQPVPQAVTFSAKRDFIENVHVMITEMQYLIGNETRVEQSRLAQAQNRCQEESRDLHESLTSAHQQLTDAEADLSRRIRVFAHVAKTDIGNRVKDLMNIGQEDAKMRDRVRKWSDEAAAMSEMITLSICDDDCSGHGSCRSGVCLCDEGWHSLNCSER